MEAIDRAGHLQTRPNYQLRVRQLLKQPPNSASILNVSNDIQNYKNEDSESVSNTLYPVIFVAQLIFVLPIDNHSWNSFRTVRCVFSIVAGLTLTMITSFNLVVENVNLNNLGGVIFCMFSTLYMMYFFRLATQWSQLIEEWLRMEKNLDGLPRVKVAAKIRYLTILIFILSIYEHLLANISLISVMLSCPNGTLGHNFYLHTFRQIFRYTPYTLWKGLVATLVNFILTLVWSFTDLFILAVCVAVAARFKQISLHLNRTIGQDMPPDFWRQSRERYLKLSLVTKRIDDHLSVILLMSFANNLYTILVMLHSSLRFSPSTLTTVYQYTCLSLLVLRTFGICIAAAAVNDYSREPFSALFSVPTHSYNVEIHRFVTQIWYDPVALTVYKFFSISRGIILKVVGTIVTYEIIFLQFNSLNSDVSPVDTAGLCPFI